MKKNWKAPKIEELDVSLTMGGGQVLHVEAFDADAIKAYEEENPGWLAGLGFEPEKKGDYNYHQIYSSLNSGQGGYSIPS